MIPKYLFEQQFHILRMMGPLGAKLCWNYIMAAYSRVPSLAYKEYIFELFYGKEVYRRLRQIFSKGYFQDVS